ncbi:sensor histidine kinase [Corallococcus sp. AB004]|nr:sensor histidine kinase [Corallococcus sp. AB004]
MVTSVLDLSRVQSGQPLQRNAGASVDLIVQNVLRDLAFEADERKVQLVYDAAAKPVRAPIDDPLVERALSNLVSNAIAVSSAGKTVRITCELVTRKRPGAANPVPAVQLSVADQGPGVPAHARDWIFRPFASLEVGGRRSTGLGLTIAREMITAHGGELSLADTSGPGATFTFWIPLEDPASPGGRLDA